MLLEFRGSQSPAVNRTGVRVERVFFDPNEVTSVLELMTPVGNGTVMKPEALVNIKGAGNLTVEDDDRDTAKRINAALSNEETLKFIQDSSGKVFIRSKLEQIVYAIEAELKHNNYDQAYRLIEELKGELKP